MRLMLGINDSPSLLVDVDKNFSPSNFKFWVVNGAWEGVFTHGKVTVLGAPSGDFSSLECFSILSSDKNRLTGPYAVVFDNYHNENYISPYVEKEKLKSPTNYLDDIPF